jgi:serine/threonine protein kinase
VDLFALGAVLHELLFGQPPFEGRSEEETLERLRLAELALDESRLSPADRPLLSVLRRCLAREPADRFPSAGALAVELRRYLATQDRPPDRATLAAWMARARAGPPGDTGSLLDERLGQADGASPSTATVATPPGDHAAPTDQHRDAPGGPRGR